MITFSLINSRYSLLFATYLLPIYLSSYIYIYIYIYIHIYYMYIYYIYYSFTISRFLVLPSAASYQYIYIYIFIYTYLYIYIYIYISYIYIYIYIHIYSDTMMTIIQCTHPRWSPQWLCSDMPAMDGQWRSSHVFSVRTNRVCNKH